MPCAGLPSPTGFLHGVLSYIDCTASSVGEEGWRALVTPGSYFSVIVTLMLTLFVALYGYRLLLGHAPSLRDGVITVLKIGIVLTFTLSWPAYRTLIYDVVLHGPAELAATAGQGVGLPGAGGGLVERLELTDRALVALAVTGTGDPPPATDLITPPQPFGGFNSFALGAARSTYLTATIAAFGIVRAVAGLLLALGPLFIALMLFAGTRGLFEGWVRLIGGAALGSVAVAVLLGVELALLDPWLTDLLARRAANQSIPAAPVELLVISLAFALALGGVLYAAFRLAMGFGLPARRPWRELRVREPVAVPAFVGGVRSAADPLARHGDAAPVEARSRAAVIADAMQQSVQRETALATAGAGPAAAGAVTRATQIARTTAPEPGSTPASVAVRPFGQSGQRRTSTRASAGASRRDERR